MQALTFVANLCTILSVPLIFWDGIERTSAIQWNPTMTYTNYITLIRSLAVLYTILKRAKIDLGKNEVLRKYRRLRLPVSAAVSDSHRTAHESPLQCQEYQYEHDHRSNSGDFLTNQGS